MPCLLSSRTMTFPSEAACSARAGVYRTWRQSALLSHSGFDVYLVQLDAVFTDDCRSSFFVVFAYNYISIESGERVASRYDTGGAEEGG